MIYQIIAILLVLFFVWLMVAHIKEAWHDFTHMDEYIERVTFKRELRKAKKDGIALSNHNATERFKKTGIMF
ncbi:MAG: hypothetical protein K2X94_00840 [Amoebophilaceae bacterium]|nr:hypothetical protein [Amoebophilaceae bacterium]